MTTWGGFIDEQFTGAPIEGEYTAGDWMYDTSGDVWVYTGEEWERVSGS